MMCLFYPNKKRNKTTRACIDARVYIHDEHFNIFVQLFQILSFTIVNFYFFKQNLKKP